MTDEQQHPEHPASNEPAQPEASPSKPATEKSTARATASRIVVWVVVGGLGIYFLAEGIIGLVTKSR